MSAPALYFEVSTMLSPLWDPDEPETRWGTVSMRVDRDPLVEVHFTWGPAPADTAPDLDAEWVLELETPRIHPSVADGIFDLEVVAGVTEHFSQGRRCLVTVIAEPHGWQSMRVTRREPARQHLELRWASLGFMPSGEVIPAPQKLWRIAENFTRADWAGLRPE